jgi:hypothetical protein
VRRFASSSFISAYYLVVHFYSDTTAPEDGVAVKNQKIFLTTQIGFVMRLEICIVNRKGDARTVSQLGVPQRLHGRVLDTRVREFESLYPDKKMVKKKLLQNFLSRNQLFQLPSLKYQSSSSVG